MSSVDIGESGGTGQFLHLDKFAVIAPRGKSSGSNIFSIANEAERVDGFCDHVVNPERPSLVWGVSPSQAAKEAEAWARSRTAEYVHKPTGRKKLRKCRLDTACALVSVVSVPNSWKNDERWRRFVARTLDWLKKKYEERLRSVVEHRDERCLHLHIWVVPRQGESFSAIHPGVMALEKLGRKAPRINREAVYKKAMSALLDEFSAEVAIGFGLERTSVKGKRFTRDQLMRKRYFDEQRELDVQKRIDAAVAVALAEASKEPLRFAELSTSKAPVCTCPPHTSAFASNDLPASIPLIGFNLGHGGGFLPIVAAVPLRPDSAAHHKLSEPDRSAPTTQLIRTLPGFDELLKRPATINHSQSYVSGESGTETIQWLRPRGG
jgi:hypothetical protein